VGAAKPCELRKWGTSAADLKFLHDVRDDAACGDAGTKPGTPAHAKCGEDMSNRRHTSQMAARIGMQNQKWSQQGH
jgi:hypothetical protein